MTLTKGGCTVWILCGMAYEGQVTTEFVKSVKKLHKNQLKVVLDALLENPYSEELKSHQLWGDWAGFRGANFDEVNRIVFRVCEECIIQKHYENFPKGCCKCDPNGEPPQKVIFVDFGNYHASAGPRKRLRPANEYGITPAVEEESDVSSDLPPSPY